MLESLPPLDARRAELYRHLHDLVDQVRPEDADTAESLLRVACRGVIMSTISCISCLVMKNLRVEYRFRFRTFV